MAGQRNTGVTFCKKFHSAFQRAESFQKNKKYSSFELLYRYSLRCFATKGTLIVKVDMFKQYKFNNF